MENKVVFGRTFILILGLIFYQSSYAFDIETFNIPEDKGMAIFMEADKRDEGFQNFTTDMRMVLKNRQGQAVTRALRSKTLEMENDGDKTIMIFDSPSDVKGTAFLSFSHKIGPDDQWMFLPALKRVKRVSSANKSGSFMGGEFSYEDLSSQEVEKYTFKYLRDEVYKKRKCFVVERYPVDRTSGYTRHVVWMDQIEVVPWKIEYYNRRNALLKTLFLRKYRKHLGKYWRAANMLMNNEMTKKSTLLAWSNYKFRVGLRERDFHPRSLRSVR